LQSCVEEKLIFDLTKAEENYFLNIPTLEMFFKSRKSIDKGTSSSPKMSSNSQHVPARTIVQIVKNCRVCDMVNIGDNKRILCPYCGSFYDTKMQKNVADKNAKSKRNSLVSFLFKMD
jgi:hypothetical protein